MVHAGIAKASVETELKQIQHRARNGGSIVSAKERKEGKEGGEKLIPKAKRMRKFINIIPELKF